MLSLNQIVHGLLLDMRTRTFAYLPLLISLIVVSYLLPLPFGVISNYLSSLGPVSILDDRDTILNHRQLLNVLNLTICSTLLSALFFGGFKLSYEYFIKMPLRATMLFYGFRRFWRMVALLLVFGFFISLFRIISVMYVNSDLLLEPSWIWISRLFRFTNELIYLIFYYSCFIFVTEPKRTFMGIMYRGITVIRQNPLCFMALSCGFFFYHELVFWLSAWLQERIQTMSLQGGYAAYNLSSLTQYPLMIIEKLLIYYGIFFMVTSFLRHLMPRAESSARRANDSVLSR